MARNSSRISCRLAIDCVCGKSSVFERVFVTPRCARRWSAVHLDNLILDVLLDPFLLGKRLVRDGVISIQAFTAIHPQSSKLNYRR